MADLGLEGASENFKLSNRATKFEAETKVDAADNPSADIGFLLSRIPLFDGSGYEIWSIMMKTMFISQDLWDLVEGGYTEKELTFEESLYVRKKDARTLFFIQQAIDKSVFFCIAKSRTSKEAWDALQNKYQGDQEEQISWKLDDESVCSFPAYANESEEASWDALEQGYQFYGKAMEANRTSEELGDFNNNFFSQGWCNGDFSGACRDDISLSGDGIGKDLGDSNDNSVSNLSGDGIKKDLGDSNNNSVSKKGSRENSSRKGRGCKNSGSDNSNGHGRDTKHLNNPKSCRAVDSNKPINPNHGSRRGGGRRGINRKGLNDGCLNDNHSECGDSNDPKIELISSSAGNAIKLNEAQGEEEQDFNSMAHVQLQSQDGRTSDGGNQSRKAQKNGKKVNAKSCASKQERALAGEKKEVSPNKVFVGNLSESTTAEDLRKVFGCFGGTISSVIVPKDGDGKSKCFGFVHFKDADDAAWSVQVLNGHQFDNKKWKVTTAYKSKSAGRAHRKKPADEPALSCTDSSGTKSEISVDESLQSPTAKATKSKRAGKAVKKECTTKIGAATVECP
ncbi:unnamed protein product [Cuscuta europaea]|uniref:RRM domain-containing protein n=1 Tax=Cuscuta europaea TaxID=41803 RepID=A0A9P0ZU02_CUSEU|nr:unnamed protein product [Cuscuta europaea]